MHEASRKPSRVWLRLADVVFLLALGVYTIAGVSIAPFHGDEPMQIYMSHDYVTAFVERQPERLTTRPPYDIDSDAHLRLINGSVNRYTIGLAWHLAGLTSGDLPPRPGWDWGLDYDFNVATGHRPSEALMLASRLPSALFTALSAVALFALAWQFGERPLAYVVTLIYALNPVILLNGRRALQEGSVLCFGILAILIAAWISKRRTDGKPDPLAAWLALIAACALTLASKHSGVVFVAAALGWIFAAELVRWRLNAIAVTTLKLIAGGLLIIVLFVALSPALWNDPIARFGDLLAERSRLLDIQVAVDPLAPMTIAQRLEAIVAQPFSAPLMHFEVGFWAQAQPIAAEIDAYMRSPLSGLHPGGVIGWGLTLLAAIGIIAAVLQARKPLYAGLLVWMVVTVASLLVNPLPWQRYYLPLIPLAALLAGIGLYAGARLFALRYGQRTSADNPAPVEV